MVFEVTKHAALVIAERGIRPEWIEMALKSPAASHIDATDPQLEHRLAIIEEYGSRVLRVILKREIQPYRVVTAFFDRKMKGKL